MNLEFEKTRPNYTEGDRKKPIYEVLTSREFFTDLIPQISCAQRKILIQTTNVEMNDYTRLLLGLLSDAAKRGLKVSFIYDVFSEFTSREKPILTNFLQARRKSLMEKLKKSGLEEAGVWLKRTGREGGVFSNLPIGGLKGMDHKKIFIIDDAAYIGGVNLGDNDFNRIDMMLGIRDPRIVRVLEAIYERNFSADNKNEDEEHIVSEDHTILVDGGQAGNSIILDSVKRDIDDEQESVVFVSQFHPTGDLQYRLNRAYERGVKVLFITGKNSFQNKIKNGVSYIATGFQPVRFPTIRSSSPVHAKVIIFGESKVYLGSSNFDEFLVRLGTKDISLCSTNPEIVQRARGFVELI